MNNYYKVLLSLCIFSILYSLFFIKIYRYPILGDGRTYYAYGENLYKGNGYSWQVFPPFAQSNLREPAYPFFVFLLFKMFGASKEVIQIAQAILNGLIVAATYYLANLVFDNKKISLTAAFLTAISPTIAGYSALIASETLSVFYLMLASISLLALLKERKSVGIIGFAILAGLFYGCIVLTKMAYLLFFPLICLVLFIALSSKSIKLKAVLCMVIIFIGILLPWLSFNNRVYGNPFFLTNRSGVAFTVKAERLNLTPKETLVSFIYPLSEGLVQRYFPREYKKVTYNPEDGSAFKAAYDKYDSLISRGYSEMAADKQLRIGALSKIRKHILKYTILSMSDFHYMLYFEGLPLSQFTESFKRDTRFAINAFFKIYSLLIMFFAVKGIFIMFRKKENTVIKAAFLLPILYTLFMYSAIFGAPRFTFTVIPFIYILASVSIYELIKTRMAL